MDGVFFIQNYPKCSSFGRKTAFLKMLIFKKLKGNTFQTHRIHEKLGPENPTLHSKLFGWRLRDPKIISVSEIIRDVSLGIGKFIPYCTHPLYQKTHQNAQILLSFFENEQQKVLKKIDAWNTILTFWMPL